MADYYVKRGDTGPPITATLTDSAGDAVNLTGATVRFILRPIRAAVPVVEAAATIVSEPAGTVRYDWAEGETDTVGGYFAEWEVTFGEGTVETFPNDSYNSVRIVADLEEVS